MGDADYGFPRSILGIEKRPWAAYIYSMQVALGFEKHARPLLDFQRVTVINRVNSEIFYRPEEARKRLAHRCGLVAMAGSRAAFIRCRMAESGVAPGGVEWRY